jgi:hypothetical protein
MARNLEKTKKKQIRSKETFLSLFFVLFEFVFFQRGAQLKNRKLKLIHNEAYVLFFILYNNILYIFL